MAVKFIDSETRGQIIAILDEKFWIRLIQKKLMEKGICVSIGKISKIKNRDKKTSKN